MTVVTGPAVSRKLAINRLRERRLAEPAVIDRFLARYDVPIVEGARCTFLYRGEADQVSLVHRAVGLPELRSALAARNRAGDGVEHEDPAQGELAHGNARQ